MRPLGVVIVAFVAWIVGLLMGAGVLAPSKARRSATPRRAGSW
jgi:hypothetical protein